MNDSSWSSIHDSVSLFSKLSHIQSLSILAVLQFLPNSSPSKPSVNIFHREHPIRHLYSIENAIEHLCSHAPCHGLSNPISSEDRLATHIDGAMTQKRKRGSGRIKSESKDTASIKEEDGSSISVESTDRMGDTKPLLTEGKSITPKTDRRLDEEENTTCPNGIEMITTETERKRRREVQFSRARDKLDREDEEWGPAVKLYLESLLESMTPVESPQPPDITALNSRNLHSHRSEIKDEDMKASGSDEEERKPKRQRLDSAGAFQGQHQGPTLDNAQPYRKHLKYESEEKVKLTTDQKNGSTRKSRRRRQPPEYIDLTL